MREDAIGPCLALCNRFVSSGARIGKDRVSSFLHFYVAHPFLVGGAKVAAKRAWPAGLTG